MERLLSSFIASLCITPLVYFATAGLLIVLNQAAQGPDNRLGVAYLSTYGGFAAAIAGFFLVWFLSHTFLAPNYLRAIQIFDAVAIVCWGVVFFFYADQQPKKLEYADHYPVLDVELRAKKSCVASAPYRFDYYDQLL